MGRRRTAANPAGADGVSDRYERVEVTSAEQWRAWLADHHADTPGVWVVTYKRAAVDAHVPYDDLVEEALCFGWIDSLPRKLDDERSMLLMTPRKPRSGWSRANKVRVEKLAAAGRIEAPGRAVIAAAKADGSWSALDAVEALEEPDDLRAALDATAGAREHWDGFPRSAKRGILEWILQAKRPETRARRIAETAARAAQGERANQWRPRGPR